MEQGKGEPMLEFSSPHLFDAIDMNLYRRTCIVGKYELTEELGRGGFARVFKCRSNGRNYAMKIYDLVQIRNNYNEEVSDKIIDLIQKQALLMKECKSPHVIKCIETFQNELYKFLILQYCSTMNLRDFLMKKGGSLPQETAIAIMWQICLGLVELHKRNIIHRDLKLENIMIVDKKCKIIDLGLSKKLESESKVMVTNVGTDYTKAPEVKGWRDSSGYGLVADIYSLGIIYLILISDYTYERRTRYNFHENRKVLFSKPISKQSEDFLERTLQEDQFKRINWRQLLHHDLFKGRQSTDEPQIQNCHESFIDIQKHVDEQISGSIHFEQSIKQTVDVKGSANSNKLQQKPKSQIYGYQNVQTQESLCKSQIKSPPVAKFKLPTIILTDNDEPENQQQPLEVKSYYLQCKKAEFIEERLIQSLQRSSHIFIKAQQESYIILMHLLSLNALNLIQNAHQYFSLYHNDKFSEEVSCIYDIITAKHQFYQEKLQSLLKCVHSAFIENQILRNYEPLKQFLNFKDMERSIDLKEQQMNLIDHYIHKFAAKFPHMKIMARLLSFRKVMMIKLDDIKGTCFEAKVEEIQRTNKC